MVHTACGLHSYRSSVAQSQFQPFRRTLLRRTALITVSTRYHKYVALPPFSDHNPLFILITPFFPHLRFLPYPRGTATLQNSLKLHLISFKPHYHRPNLRLSITIWSFLLLHWFNFLPSEHLKSLAFLHLKSNSTSLRSFAHMKASSVLLV